MGTLHEDKYMVLIICCSVLFRMKKVSDKRCRQNQNKHFFFLIVTFVRYCGKIL